MKYTLLQYAKILTATSFIALLLTGCGISDSIEESDLSFLSPNESYDKSNNYAEELVADDNSLYEDDDKVKTLYITVGKGSSDDKTNHTWDEVRTTELKWYDDYKVEQYKCESIIQFGNDDGPVMGEYGYGITTANSTIKLVGESASERQQKNYKIELKNGSGNIDGMKSFILSKGFTDPYRFMEKLSYGLMQDIPELLSTRTYFVHLYVKDVTENKDTKFVDYGLYTMIEPINKKYLKSRNLNNSGELYKAVNFDWKRHEDVIVAPTDSKYDEKEFSKLLESKGGNDYAALIDMLQAVNDYNIPIEDTIELYFDEDNIYTWMAFNILINNRDVDNENYYIYSPLGTERFYFISWDNDSALRSDYELLKDSEYDESESKGVFAFRNSVLFSRMLKSERCINKLGDKVEELYNNQLSPENVSARANELAGIVKPYTYSLPDMSFARVTEANYDKLVASIGNQIEKNYYDFYDSLLTPWPFEILEPKVSGGQVVIEWEESYFAGTNRSYTVEVDDSWDFATPFINQKDIKDNSYNIGKLSKGQYFVRITSVSENGIQQKATNYYNSETKSRIYGVMCFYLLEDGTVVESVFD